MTWRDRILADHRDIDAWREARRLVIGASDAATLSKLASLPLYLTAKLKSDTFQGNAFTAHGHAMEPGLLAYAGYEQNHYLIRSVDEPGFAATPDGIREEGGRLRLAQAKTTNKPFKTIPLRYRRQVWWEQMVLGAEQTDFIWAEHDGDFELKDIDPHISVIDRDDNEIHKMLAIATPLLAAMRAAADFESELVA